MLQAIIAIVFFTYVGQFLLNTAIAPLSRAMGLAEWHIGAAISLAAVMVTLLSQRWGRASVSVGRKPVLVLALIFALIAGLLFAIVTYLRMAMIIGAGLAATGIIIARGGFFGAAVAAVPPTGQALIAELTPDEQSRVRGMAAFGAAFNIAAMAGALISGLLAAWWLLAPVYATPISVGIALVIALVVIPSSEPHQLLDNPPSLSPTDPRIRPYLIVGFGMFFAMGVLQIITGFIVQDRFGYAPSQAVLMTGIGMLASGGGTVFSQLVLVPRLSWPPRRLLRIGLSLVSTSALVVALPVPIVVLLGAAIVIGVGMGLAAPGYNAGASLSVKSEEQGAVAGLLSATGGLTWVFAPITGTLIYGWNNVAAVLFAALAAGISTVVVWVHPEFRIQRRLTDILHRA